MGSERALLVAAGGGIGDTLLAGVVAHALRSRYAAVDALVLPAHRSVAEHDPVYGRVIDWNGAFGSAGALRGERYAAAVVTWATLPAALAGLLAGIPVRVGQSRRLYSPLFTTRVAVRSESGDHTTHWTQILLDYARALGCDDAAAQPAFVPTADDAAAAAGLLRLHGVAPAYRILHPTRGLSAQRSRWPAAGFIGLARALRARDGRPLLISGSAEDATFAATIARATGAISVAGETTLGAFGALAAGAQSVVAMDSGPMHIAAAVGAPTVGVFALESDEPDRWAPRGPHVAVVRATYPCPPSHRKETCPDFACVDALDVDGILRALDGLDRTLREGG
jgi:ADP-heptose:LPS heptosyltransferase